LALEINFWQKAARKSRLVKIPNDQISQTMGVQSTIEEIECKNGHVEQTAEGRLPKQILNWVPTERRKRGRPKPCWIGGKSNVWKELACRRVERQNRLEDENRKA